MKWTELYQLAADARCDFYAMAPEVEAHVAMRCGLMLGMTVKNDEQTSHVPPTLGPSQPAMA